MFTSRPRRQREQRDAGCRPPHGWHLQVSAAHLQRERVSTICLVAIACSMSCSRTTGQRFSKLAAAPAETSSMRRDAVRAPGSLVSTFRTQCSRRRARRSRGRGSPIASTCIRQTQPRSICPTCVARRAWRRVFVSYTLSMVPGWRHVLAQALEAVGPGGRLYILDFGQQEAWPRWFKAVLFAWLRQFSVYPRAELESELTKLANDTGAELEFRRCIAGTPTTP